MGNWKTAFAAIVLMAGSSFAQSLTPMTWEIGPFGGLSMTDDYGSENLDDHWLLGGRVGFFVTPHISFEVSGQWGWGDVDRVAFVNDDADSTMQSARFNALINLLPNKVIVPFITGGVGWDRVDVDATSTLAGYDDDGIGYNAGGGFRVFLSDNVAVRFDGRWHTVDDRTGDRQHNYEATAGLSFLLGGHGGGDADGDGVNDNKDECAATPAGATVDAKGCPADADGDGVYNGIDTCADTAKGVAVDEKGCAKDSDGDGVLDGADKCPESAKDAKVDETGCVPSADADADGVADGADQCPNTAKGVTVDEKGCAKDSDGDGVADHLDYCRGTAKGTEIDANGCPLKTKSRGVLKGVNFEFGSARLTSSSETILASVAKELLEFPRVNIEVQGHTDNTGPDASNLALSQKRAQSVVEYLVSQGVPRERLIAKGYGETTPIASNATKDGRYENRRVQLNWLDGN